ncbi:Abi family protein [Corynebacterium lehmanniae]|uniref:Abi family protein n=1 Tax=Corynebacterium lehmanniae TaxID=2913497 RepID=A0ABT4RBI2_9CORY|nr:Abi family protein [Corynebacterium lehmanniae]
MVATKPFREYADLLALLADRGMRIANTEAAEKALRNIGYYRLSGYWYSFRKPLPDQEKRRGFELARMDEFRDGTNFDDIVRLYAHDTRLRKAALSALEPVEIWLRNAIAHTIGSEHPLLYLHLDNPSVLDLKMRSPIRDRTQEKRYAKWLDRFDASIDYSKEDFVQHYRNRDEDLPIWVAVQTFEWGALRNLYDLLPKWMREKIAFDTGLTFKELGSWQRSLAYMRNTCAHYSRLYNRVDDAPLMPRNPRSDLSWVRAYPEPLRERTFFKLSMLQYLHGVIKGGPHEALQRVVSEFLRADFPGHDLSAQANSLPIPEAIGCPPNVINQTLWA